LRRRKGHDTWMMGVDDFSHRADGTVAAHARSAANKHHTSEEAFLESIQDDAHGCDDISINDLEVLLMRNDPAEDMSDRPWAVTSGVLFAQLSVAGRTLVVNDPSSLANAVNKTYFNTSRRRCGRGRSSRDPGDISAFVKEMGAGAVLKPCRDQEARASSSSSTTSRRI
jgi:glutathione synthase